MLHTRNLFDTSNQNGRYGAVTEHDHTGSESTVHGGQISKITAKQLMALVHRQGYRCALTGRHLTPDTASVDHIIPLSEGGDHAVHNLQVVHKHLNNAKGTMSQHEFIAMCREVVEWALWRGRQES